MPFCLISSRFRSVLWIVRPSSIPVQCLHGKVVLFIARSFLFWYFSDFQRLVQVKSASMTNTKPLGGVVCHYCHNPGHVRQNCRKL